MNIDVIKPKIDIADPKKLAQLIEPQTAHISRIANQTTKAVCLELYPTKYTEESQHLNGKTIKYRVYHSGVYVAHLADASSEFMNIFILEAYFQQGTVNEYTVKSAPIFLPNGVGGYMSGNVSELRS